MLYGVNIRGREHGPSGSRVMLLRHVVVTMAFSRRFTANDSMLAHVPHAEAWGYALCSLRERVSAAVCLRSSAEKIYTLHPKTN